MKRVAIFPPWEPWLGNRMFQDAEGCINTSSFRRWKEKAAEGGFELATHDVCTPEKADVLWFMDLPRARSVFERARLAARSGARFVLQILESPLFCPAAFVPENRKVFDAVVSYEFQKDEGLNFACPLPVETDPVYEGKPFQERKLAVMVNTNRVEGWFSTRKTGWPGLPGIGGYFSGWKMPLGHFLRPAKGQLYGWRRQLAREAEKTFGEEFEIFGPDWSGEQISWLGACFNRKYLCHRIENVQRDGAHKFQNKRLHLGSYKFVIAVENFKGSRRYISEKIFDAMLGDSVPVYQGEETITQYVPKEAFVDASKFCRPEDLLRHLREMPESQWMGMRAAGGRFLKSDAFRRFTDKTFACRMKKILVQLYKKT